MMAGNMISLCLNAFIKMSLVTSTVNSTICDPIIENKDDDALVGSKKVKPLLVKQMSRQDIKKCKYCKLKINWPTQSSKPVYGTRTDFTKKSRLFLKWEINSFQIFFSITNVKRVKCQNLILRPKKMDF